MCKRTSYLNIINFLCLNCNKTAKYDFLNAFTKIYNGVTEMMIIVIFAKDIKKHV